MGGPIGGGRWPPDPVRGEAGMDPHRRARRPRTVDRRLASRAVARGPKSPDGRSGVRRVVQGGIRSGGPRTGYWRTEARPATSPVRDRRRFVICAAASRPARVPIRPSDGASPLLRRPHWTRGLELRPQALSMSGRVCVDGEGFPREFDGVAGRRWFRRCGSSLWDRVLDFLVSTGFLGRTVAFL